MTILDSNVVDSNTIQRKILSFFCFLYSSKPKFIFSFVFVFKCQFLLLWLCHNFSGTLLNLLRNHYFPILFKSKELIMKFQEFTITVACMPNHWCQSGSLWLGFIWIWIFVRSYLLENPRDRYKCWYKSEQKMWDHNTEICMYVVVHVAISAKWSTFQRWNILKLVTLADPEVIHLKWNEGTSKHRLQTWLLILSATVSF